MSLRMKVYVVAPDGGRETIVEPYEYEGDGVPMGSLQLPKCTCPRCAPRAQQPAERTAS